MKLLLGLLLLVCTLGLDSPLDTTENQLLQACNQLRQSRGLAPLAASSYLQRAARGHSEEMLKVHYFDHESPLPERRYPWDRVALAGADADSMAENIFQAQGHPMGALPDLAVKAWLASPEHLKNLIDPGKTDAGVGIASDGKLMCVTMVFSSPLTPIEK